jgi:hypothetical protein
MRSDVLRSDEGTGGRVIETVVVHSIHATMTAASIAFYPISLNIASPAWNDYPPIPAKLLPLIILTLNEDLKAR